MKYNPRACISLAMLDGFLARHPYAAESLSQGFLSCMYELQEILADVTGMKAASRWRPWPVAGRIRRRGDDHGYTAIAA